MLLFFLSSECYFVPCTEAAISNFPVSSFSSLPISTIEDLSQDFLENYSGFFNDRLYYNGLSDYQNISFLSSIYQIIILFASFIAMYSLLYFFNVGQQKKLAILKTIGSSNLNLLRVNFSQIILMLIFSIILAIPLQFTLFKLIIKNRFNVSSLNISNAIYIFIVLIVWILVIICISFIPACSSQQSLFNSKNKKDCPILFL